MAHTGNTVNRIQDLKEEEQELIEEPGFSQGDADRQSEINEKIDKLEEKSGVDSEDVETSKELIDGETDSGGSVSVSTDTVSDPSSGKPMDIVVTGTKDTDPNKSSVEKIQEAAENQGAEEFSNNVEAFQEKTDNATVRPDGDGGISFSGRKNVTEESVEKTQRPERIEKVPESSEQGNTGLTRDLIYSSLYPGNKVDKTKALEKSLVKDNLIGVNNQKELSEKLVREDPSLILQPDRKEKTIKFIQNVEAQDQAGERKTELNKQIEDIEDSEGSFLLKTEEGEKTVSKDKAVEILEEQKSKLNEVIDTAQKNKEILVSGPIFTGKESSKNNDNSGKLDIDLESGKRQKTGIPEFSRYPLAKQELAEKKDQLSNQLMGEKQRNKLKNEIERLETKARTPASYPGYTQIQGQTASFGALPEKEGFNDLDFSDNSDNTEALKKADLNDFTPGARFVRSLQVLSTTPEGFSAYGSFVDPDRSFSDVVSEGSKELAEDKGAVEKTSSFVSSPAGLVATGGIGKVAGAGVKGLQAYGIGTGTAGKILGKTAQIGGAGLVAYETGKGASKIQEGEISEGTGDILRVGAEAGVFVRGFQKASQKYGPKLARTTKVSQKNILRQIDPEDGDKFLVGSGEMTAGTTIKQRVPLKGGDPEDLKNVDTAVSKADYKIVADRQGSEAQGTIQDRVLSGSPTEKEFQSLSTVKAREGDQFIQQDGDVINNYRPGEDELVTKTTLRTEEEGRLLRSFEDTSRTSISRKEGEAPINEIRGYSLKAQVRNNVEAKNIRFSGYSRDQDGEIISETENLVFGKSKSGDVTGGSGQGLEYSNKYGDGFIQETQRQSRGAQQFGSRSRQTARDQLDSGSQVQGVSTSGGSQAEGSQTGISEEVAVSPGGTETIQETRDQGTIQETRNVGRAQVSKRAGQQLKEDLGIKSIQESPRNTQGARTRTRGKTSTIRQNKNVQRLNQETKTREDVIQGTGQIQVQTPGQIQKNRQVRGIRNTQVQDQTVKTVGLGTLQGRGQLQKLSTTQINMSKTPIQTTPGGLMMDLDLDSLNADSRSGNQSQGTQTDSRGEIKISILSANRSELLTGSKTFNINEENVSDYNQSPLSGGVKTEESKKLNPRQYNTNKEVEFY